MRLGLIIVMLTAIGVSLVHLRNRTERVRSEMHRLQLEKIALVRQIWDKQVQLAYLTTPEEVRRRAEAMKLNLTDGRPGGEEPVNNGPGAPHRR